MRHHRQFGAAVALLLAAAASGPTAAQAPARFGVGVALGMTRNLAEAFSRDQVCRHRGAVSASVRGTAAITRLIQAEVLGEGFLGPGPSCVNGLHPPPPESGPFVYRYEYYEERLKSPPAVLSLRLGATLPRLGAWAARPYAGVAALADKGITARQAGLTIVRGQGHTRLLLEAEAWWYTVPRRHAEEEFLDRQLIRTTETEEKLRTFTTVFRLGFASR